MCSLDDDIWEIRFHFPGEDNLERTLCESDITVKNLMALIEGHGYGYEDTIYYVKAKGTGFEGMEPVTNMEKVEEMLQMFGSEKVLYLTVIRKNGSVPAGLNFSVLEPQFRIDEPVIISVDKDGVTYISDDETIYPVAVDYSHILFVGTQQSCNMEKGKAVDPGNSVPLHSEDDHSEDNPGDDDDMFYMGEYRPVEHDKAIAEEQEYIRELKRKREEIVDPEELLMVEKMQADKRQREDLEEHIEAETDVEELCSTDEESEEEEVIVHDFEEKKWLKSKGPTTRCHHETNEEEINYFVPTSDEDSSPDDLGDTDDDEYVKQFALASGRKRQLKKMKKRVWYDEDRMNAHEQFAVKLCFRDVYQFRIALMNYHIAQLRQFSYHRNNSDRIIAKCKMIIDPEEKKKKDRIVSRVNNCPFYITASQIENEKTFCIRKFRPVHTCPTEGENTKVTINWLAKQSEQAVRIDPNTCVDTLIDNAKQKFGVVVPKSKAYRARKKAFDVVMGDQKKQYTRLRDYLQAILDTNPGSRCIVTTKELVEHPSANPRFYGLFVCLNASKEGFLNGCRPFIGKFAVFYV